ncbi:MAG: amidohydrolase [Luminiphilus sp.]|nr:amidohydrolase [Halieaceae bacterium]MDG2441826.1 amidohydrolase [Luminiphilus sp.]
MTYRVGLLVSAAFLLGLYLLFQIATRPPEAPEHQVFVNGQILTMNAENRVVEALSVRGAKVSRVGSTEEILAEVTDKTVVTDLRGRTLMPGFVDAHGHFPGSGQVVFSTDLNSPPIGNIEDMSQLLERLKDAHEARPDGWLTGFGYDDTLLAEGRHPTREDLDQISATRPIAIGHVSGHLYAVNSAALAEIGIDESTPDPKGGVIQRDPTSPDGRRPNGVLEETASRQVLLKALDIGITDGIRMTTHAAREYLQAGVTTASAGGMPLGLAKLLGPLSQLNVFPQRVALFPLLEEVESEVLSGEWRPEAMAAGRLSLPRVKIIADGSIQGYTGYLSEPYYEPYKGDVLYRGYPSVSRDDLFRQVEGLHIQKIQYAIHVNGDASVEDALDAIAAAQQSQPWPDARPLFIHAQMSREDQIQRMAQLGVTPSFFSSHTYYWGDRHAAIFMGPERAANMSPAGWALDAGIRYSAHADTPVTPMLPLQVVWSQVNRITTGGAVLGRHQRVAPMAALRAVTIDAAWQVFMDDSVGSLEPGKLADMVVLSGSPLESLDVRELLVERTFIGGAEVYTRR